MNCTALVIGKHCVIVVMLQGFERASSKDGRSPAGSFEVTLLLAFPWAKPAEEWSYSAPTSPHSCQHRATAPDVRYGSDTVPALPRTLRIAEGSQGHDPLS